MADVGEAVPIMCVERKRMRIAKVLCVLIAPGWLFGALGTARADITYNYVEFGGAPIFNSPVKIKVIDDKVKFTGVGYGGVFSFALHPNWHVRVSGKATSADSGNVKPVQDPETSEPVIEGRLKTDTIEISVVPHFNYRITENTDLILALGAIWGKRDFQLALKDAKDRERLIEGQLNKEEWGVTAGAGVRSMLWRNLEGFGDFRISSVSLLENEIFFNLGMRYHFWDVATLGAQVQVSTSSFIGLWMGLRLHYAEIYRRSAD